ncbi:superoxide dismutase family protein [Modicisalibacter radicis]|uniref:superoxide dismutase family protein n=1 Tax=Halomonas sp. EAR18 TaxID=2518972 RepID=UPI00109C121D|nr:superoxide dismutase family protein [Halomonas sp. EAR18]
MRLSQWMVGLGVAALTTAGAYASTSVEMHAVSADGSGEPVGTINVEKTEWGVKFTPDLEGLETGMHGFHLHQNRACDPAVKDGETVAAGAAGGHFDPEGSGTHQGPYGEGHLGDLPLLTVDAQGTSTTPVLAPRLTMDDVKGHALVIHNGGDTYGDEPHLGGGGSRVACGLFEG